MSRAEQVTRVARVVGAFRVTAALRAIGLPRATWYRHQRRRVYADKYGHLREALEQIARTHPEYGYRRVAVELQRTWRQPVNAKVVPWPAWPARIGGGAGVRRCGINRRRRRRISSPGPSAPSIRIGSGSPTLLTCGRGVAGSMSRWCWTRSADAWSDGP